jgi:cysteine dioxygenase
MNIDEFIKYLENNKIKDDMINNKDILELLNINWRDYINLNKKKYSKECVFKNNDYELFVISWLPKQHTQLHLHPDNGCIMRIVYGELNEIIIDNNDVKENHYYKNNNSFMSNEYGKHIISNINNKLAISLHLYSPPNFYNN